MVNRHRKPVGWRVPIAGIKMPKACPLLVSELNPQLGWGAQWKGVVVPLAPMTLDSIEQSWACANGGETNAILREVRDSGIWNADAVCP